MTGADWQARLRAQIDEMQRLDTSGLLVCYLVDQAKRLVDWLPEAAKYPLPWLSMTPCGGIQFCWQSDRGEVVAETVIDGIEYFSQIDDRSDEGLLSRESDKEKFLQCLSRCFPERRRSVLD